MNEFKNHSSKEGEIMTKKIKKDKKSKDKKEKKNKDDKKDKDNKNIKDKTYTNMTLPTKKKT